MKAMLSTLLLVLAGLCASAPTASAQVYASHSSGYRGHGYSAARVWIPTRYETVCERVWIPACSERIWIEPVYELRPSYGYRAGACVRVLVQSGHWKTVRHPGHFELRERRVYRPGHWVPRGRH